MGAERNRRRHRVLGELSTVVRGSAHLVLPAIAKFWRTELSSQGLEEVVVDTKVREDRGEGGVLVVRHAVSVRQWTSLTSSEPRQG